MGYSTSYIDVKTARKMIKAKKMKATEWTTDLSVLGRGGWRMIKSALLTDHAEPRVIINFSEYPPDFIQFEVQS